ncbi:MAG: glycosyltransferase [Steroidobacterales bacterium]
MRILKVSDVYFPRVNGVSTSIETFRNDLIGLGHEVVLVAPQYAAAAAGPAANASQPILRIAARSVPRDPEDRIMSWSALTRTLNELGHGRFDVVHIHTPFLAHYAGLRFARAFRVPVIATYHTLFEEYLHHYVPLVPRALTRPMARRFSRSQCNQLDQIVAPSRAMHDALRTYGITRPIEILPTGLAQDQFRDGDGVAFRARHAIAAERPVLLFVGRAAHEKNIGFLLEMLVDLRRRRPDVLLLIAGEGPASADLRARASQLGLGDSVRFVGYFDRGSELQDCYRAADIFVFASLTETQGLVLLESMAQGIPVVAIPKMGTVDILAPLRGCRHAPHTIDGFAATVDELLADAPGRRALGADARIYAQEWASRSLAQRLAQLYQSLA